MTASVAAAESKTATEPLMPCTVVCRSSNGQDYHSQQACHRRPPPAAGETMRKRTICVTAVGCNPTQILAVVPVQTIAPSGPGSAMANWFTPVMLLSLSWRLATTPALELKLNVPPSKT